MRPRISDCACAEKPRPPCSLEMSMPRKPCFLTKSQTSSGISLSLWRIAQSLTMRQSSLVGPSRNAFSSSVSVMGGTARSFSQSGWPGEQLGVEADGAGIERLLLGGRDLGQDALDLVVEGLDQRRPPHRRNARARPARSPAPRPASPSRVERRLMPVAVDEAGAPGQRPRPPAPRPTAQRGARRMASTKAPAMQRAMKTSSAMVAAPRRRRARRAAISRNSRP